eukprot:gene8452-10383_t
MTVFDDKVKQRQKSNSTRVDNPSDYDYLFDEVADRLTDRILDIKDLNRAKVLDFGSRNGTMNKFLQERGGNLESLIMVDSSKELLYRDEHLDSNYKFKPQRVLVDSLEDPLPFENQTFDLILSNLSIHWINDLPGVFSRLKQLLKPNGVFLASLFGEETLVELKDSLYLSEIEREGGFSPHVSPFAKVSDIGNLLSRARFALPTIDTEKIVIKYENMFTLMRDLQNMGESNAILKRRNYTSKDTFLAASSIYRSLYGNDDGSVPATFQVIFLIGWSPHESQSKPKPRGSATKHLSEIGLGSVGLKFNESSSTTEIISNKTNEQEESEEYNYPLPISDDFIIKRLDKHGNLHTNQKSQNNDKDQESTTTNNDDGQGDNNNKK